MIFQTEQKQTLDDIRKDLVTMEQTIIFALIERARFKRNSSIYERNSALCSNLGDKSFLEFMFVETEKVHALMRRYTAPDEFAFFPKELPQPLLPALRFPAIIAPHNMNFNDKVMSIYLERILPLICEDGDDSHYGSSANCDIIALQAISKRIHYGLFVAEVKFNEQPDKYAELIRAQDLEGIMATLTNAVVEARLLKRLKVKAATYGREITDDVVVAAEAPPPIYNINPDIPVRIYEEYLIPLTKEVELQYLLRRVGPVRVAFTSPEGSPCGAAAFAAFDGLCTPVPVSSIQEVFSSVLCNAASFGVVPYMNSDGSIVRATQDILFTTQAQIRGEVWRSDGEAARFLVLGGSQQHPLGARSGHDGTLLVVELAGATDALAGAVAAFAKYGVPIVSIESRAHRKGTTAYLIECDGHVEDLSLRTLLSEGLPPDSVRLIGSFRREPTQRRP